MNETILVVDDEQEIADLVAVYLKNEGYRVQLCGTAAAALACIETNKPDLAILDVMLPDMDGFSLCRRIRQQHLFPIVMLTARVEDMDKITGLSLGADDYITKPFNPLELGARVKTQLRRYLRYDAASTGEPDRLDNPGLEHLQRGAQVHPERQGGVPHPHRVQYPVVSVQAAGEGGILGGAVQRRVGRKIPGQQQHRDGPHRPPAGKAGRAAPQAPLCKNRLGGGLHR